MHHDEDKGGFVQPLRTAFDSVEGTNDEDERRVLTPTSHRQPGSPDSTGHAKSPGFHVQSSSIRSSLSNDPAEVLLEINSELLRINQEFHARNLAQTMPSELTMYTTRFQSNLTWMTQHTQAFQAMAIPGSHIPLPTLTPPPSVAFTSTERLQALYAHLPSLFSKQLDREQRKRQIQDALSPVHNNTSSSGVSPSSMSPTPTHASSPLRAGYIAMDYESMSPSTLSLDSEMSVKVNGNGKRPRVEEEDETSTRAASFSPPNTTPPSTTPANGNGHHKRISIGGGAGARRRHTSISSPSSSSAAVHVFGSSSSPPEGEDAMQMGDYGDVDTATPARVMVTTESGLAGWNRGGPSTGSMGPPPVPARARAGGQQHPHRQRPLSQPSPMQSTQSSQTDNNPSPHVTTPPNPLGSRQAKSVESSTRSTASTPAPTPLRLAPPIARDVIGPLPVSVRERARPPKELIPALLAMVQDATQVGPSSSLSGTKYMVDQSKGHVSVHLLRSQVKGFDLLPPGKKIELLWTFQQKQVAMYKKLLKSREMEREIYGREAAKRLRGTSLLAHGTVFIADGSDTGREYVDGVLQPQQPLFARASSMAPPPIPSNLRHAGASSTSPTASGIRASREPSGTAVPSTSSTSSSDLTSVGTPTAIGTPSIATSPPSALDASTPSASTPTSGSTPISSHLTLASTPSALSTPVSTPVSIPSPSWDWSFLLDPTTESNPSAPPSTLESRLDDSGLDPYAFLAAATASSAPSPASTSGSHGGSNRMSMPTPEQIQMRVPRRQEDEQQPIGVSPLSMAASPTLVEGFSPAPSFGAMSPFGIGGMSPASFVGFPSPNGGAAIASSPASMFDPSPSTTLVESPAGLLGAGLSPWNTSSSDSETSATVYVDGNVPTTNYLW